MSIVALCTSLPELAASMLSAKHNETGFIIGNIIGSNIINIIVVLGFTVLIHPITIEFSSIAIQGFFMLILTFGLSILIKYNNGINSIFGGIFILIYFLFIYFNFQNELGIKF